VSVAALPARPPVRAQTPQPPTVTVRIVPVVTTVYGVGYRLADEARLTILPDD